MLNGSRMVTVVVYNWGLLVCFTEDVYQHQARIDGEPAQLEILDTAGQVRTLPSSPNPGDMTY